MKHFGPTRMTRSQNDLAFNNWLHSCTDKALRMASADSLARSYGLRLPLVQEKVDDQLRKRGLVRDAS